MALETTKGSENIPLHGVKLSREEALSYQKSIIRDWTKESDVFFLRNARHIVFALGAASSLIIVTFLKKKFMLPNSGLVYTMYMPITLIPMSILAIQNKFDQKITNNILLMSISCPMCKQFQYLGLHLVASIAYPILSSCLLFSVMAEKYGTVAIPNNIKEPKEYYKFLYQMAKKGSSRFQGLTAINVLVLFFVPYMESIELKNVMKALKEIEDSKEITYWN